MSQLDILSAICNIKYLCNTVQIFDVNGHYVNCSNKILELELVRGRVVPFFEILPVEWSH